MRKSSADQGELRSDLAFLKGMNKITPSLEFAAFGTPFCYETTRPNPGGMRDVQPSARTLTHPEILAVTLAWMHFEGYLSCGLRRGRALQLFGDQVLFHHHQPAERGISSKGADSNGPEKERSDEGKGTIDCKAFKKIASTPTVNRKT
jgi:hypothetical protein